MKTTYELKKFKSSKDTDLIRALKLYSENIEAAYRTDSKEILYWVDNFSKQSNDLFFILGFYLNNILIGFSEIAYFTEERLLVVDYLVIDKQYRGMNTFSEFMHKIKIMLALDEINPDFIIGEVGCFFENQEPPEESKNLIRLLKMAQFGVVKCKYYVPRLGLTNYESEMVAILMLFTSNGIKQIKKETFLKIIKTLYYKYYERWYNAFQSDKEKREYKLILDSLYEKIEKYIGKRPTIEINGSYNLLPIGDYTKGLRYNKSTKILAFIFIFFSCVVLTSFSCLLIKRKLGIDFVDQTSILAFSIILKGLIEILSSNSK